MSSPYEPSELLERIIRNRRSIRRYQPRPVLREHLGRLVEAAIWAPSAHNRQPWRFAILESDVSKALLARTMGRQLRKDMENDRASADQIEADVNRSFQRITGAAAGIVLCVSMVDMDRYPDQGRQSAEYLMAVQSTAMAGQNLLLMASASGLGACWMCAPLFCADEVRAVLDLPEDWEPQALITIGYPVEELTKSREGLETRLVWR